MADKVVGIKIDVQDSGRLSQLEQNLVKLGQRRRELNKLVREGTTLTDREAKELGELGTQAQATRNKINDLKNGILKQNDALKKNSGFVAGIRKGIGQWATSMIGVTAAIAAGTKIIGHAVKVIKDFDESVADLAKTTGLSKDAARDLAKELLKINTRTSVTELLALGTAAGRLGLEGEELIGFVEQTDKAFVALGDSLSGNAEEIGLSLGKIAANFGIEEEFGIAESINKIGSSLNELGANSKAQEGAIQDFTARLSGVAKQAGLTVPEVQALGALFDESGQSIEVASTTFNQLLPLMGKEVEKFAEVAGVNVDKFSKLVRDKPFEALKLVAEGAKSSDEGLIGLTETLENYGVKSSRAASIVGVLSNKTDRLTELQEIANNAFEEGTSLADEFAIKNDTLAAKTDKLSNKWDKFLISLDGTESVIGGALGSISDFFTEALTGLENLDLIWKGTFSGLSKFTQKELERTLNSGWETEAGLNIDKVVKKFDEIPFEKIKKNTKLLRDAWVEVLGEDSTEAAILFNGYLQQRINKENALANATKKRGKTVKGAVTVDDEVIENGGDGLTESEIAAINEKARKRAEAQREAQRKALSDIEQQEAQDLEGEEGMSLDDFDAINEKNENLLALDQEFLDAEKAQREQAIFDEIEAEEEAANKVREFERLKREARNKTIDAIGASLSALSSLAKEGSAEQKGLATSAALIQTYLAINRTLGAFSGVPIPGYAFAQAAAIGITGFANVAKINAVKAQRGMLIQGNSHAMGGVPFSVGGQLGFEAEGGEAIINKKSTQMFRPLLSAINEAGGGVSFAKGGKIKKFQNGGIPNNLSVSSAQQGFLQRQLNLEEFSSTIIEGINNKQVINVASNTSDVATEVFNTQSEATF